MTRLVGTREVVDYIKEYKLTERRSHKKDNICFDILIAFENGDIKPEAPSNLSEFINGNNAPNASDLALDLLRHLLVLDYVLLYLLRRNAIPLGKL
jgi:hypothetical protein